jgi:predicted glycoside hydrolase/deacetylase ChbG (UPF0249 family)
MSPLPDILIPPRQVRCLKRILIVNADDYGRTAGVSEGIRLAHREGIVTVTTVMVNRPGALDEIRRAREETPRLALGVHLNLTSGQPCSAAEAVPSLVDTQGWFRSRDSYLADPAAVNLPEVETEWRAQIRLFLRTGAVLDHLDSHHHIAALIPALWGLCLSLACEIGCGVRPALPSELMTDALTEGYPPAIRTFVQGEASRRLSQSGVPHPDALLAGWFAQDATLPNLLNMLRGLPEGVAELMTHPGFADQPLIETSMYSRERERELAALTDPAVRRAVAQAGIRLATFRALWPGRT